MLVLELLTHSWRQSLRSASRGQNTAGNVILVLIVLLVALNLLGVGLYLHALLKTLEPGVEPVSAFNGLVVYYLGIDLLLRQMFQRIPGQMIVPYLTLRIGKSLLVHLLLLRSFASFFNLLPWLLIIPFAVNAVIPAAGPGATVAWLAGLGFLLAANSLLNLFLKKLATAAFAAAVTLGAAIAAFFALDFLQVVSLAELSRNLLGTLLESPALSAAVLGAPVLLYGGTFVLLRHRMYLEDLSAAAAQRTGGSSRYRFLESAGARGRFVALELKLFFRNRRSRASLITALAVLPFGVVFYEMMLETVHDPYPIPQGAAIEAARLSEQVKARPGLCRVTFHLERGIAPPFAHVYVTGDHPALAGWKPAALPLLQRPDSSWARSFLVEEGTNLRYCFTLGDWQTEEKVGDGNQPPVYTITVRSDTTVFRSAVTWNTPRTPLFVRINLLYWGLLMTGILMFAYGQFFLAWNSTFFDALMTWRIGIRWLLETKVMVLLGAGVVSFVLTIPYVFLGTDILLYNALAFLYNIGVNSHVLLYLASRSKKRFDLTESIFSQQGKSAAQFVAVLPMWILPVVVFAVLDGIGVPHALYILLGGPGLLGLIFHRPLLNRAFLLLERRRYEIASGFRQG